MTTDWHLIPPKQWQALTEPNSSHLAEIKAGGKKLCLVRCRGKWFAISARCSHQGGPLAAGFLNEQEEVVCPWHRFAFDPETGQSESGGYFVRTYPVKEENGNLYVEVPKKKFLGLF